MKHNYLTLLLALLMSIASNFVSAHNFAVGGIYYNITSSEEPFTAAVTYKGSSYDSYSNEYTGTVNIPETVSYDGKTYSVTSIVGRAFYNCTSMTDVTVPNSVTSIGGEAFYNTAWYNNSNGLIYAGKVAYRYKGTMPSGTKIVLRAGTLGIAVGAFSSCKSLNSITIPNSVISIGEDAFYYCTGLTSVTIGNSVTSIGNNAFYNCNSLTKAEFASVESLLGIKFGVDGNPLRYAHHLYINGEEVKDLVIPKGVTKIYSTFRNCSGLTSVDIPESVTLIGDYAFENCSGLTSVNIPESMTSIGGYAFKSCSGLTSITIPNNVTSIGNEAFYDCSSLTSVVINSNYISSNLSSIFGSQVTNYIFGDSVESIKNHACSDCSKLNSVTIGNRVTEIGDSAFFKCTSLTSITIPNSVTSIGNKAFYYCIGLTSVTMSNRIIEIGENAFYRCTCLTSIIIPNSVTSIGEGAFYDCSNINSIYVYNTNPPTITSTTFSGIGKDVTLHIPKGYKSIFQRADYWGAKFTKIIDDLDIRCKLIYMVEGEEYKSDTIMSSTKLEPITSPVKEGYTFDGWFLENGDTIPDIMPSQDVTVVARFIINSYKLTYMVDEEEYKTSNVVYGTALTPESAPTKEGYTFSGWSEIPETMPAQDVVVTGSFTINSYTLTYKVDGEEYKTSTVVYGTTLTPEAAPTKEGHTFSGWSQIPETMPAQDVVVTGTFNINSYFLFYIIDGAIYKIVSVKYGTNIIPETVSEKEGYTFSGWTDIPETMPAEDVTVQGKYIVNNYTITYKVDDEKYKTASVAYGTTLTPETEPTKEGYTFSGWSQIPETMPAQDVVITGTFTINKYTVTFIYGNNVLKTIEVEFGAEIPLPESLNREGYTLIEWLDVPETMPARNIIIFANYSDGIKAIADESDCRLYDLNGNRLSKPQRGINIVRMKDGTSRKVLIK